MQMTFLASLICSSKGKSSLSSLMDAFGMGVLSVATSLKRGVPFGGQKYSGTKGVTVPMRVS